MAKSRTRVGRRNPPKSRPTSETSLLEAGTLDYGLRSLAPIASLLVALRLALLMPGFAVAWPWISDILARLLDLVIGSVVIGETYAYWRRWRCRRLQALLLEAQLRAELDCYPKRR